MRGEGRQGIGERLLEGARHVRLGETLDLRDARGTHRLRQHGVRLLVNEAVDLGPLRLVGSDDHLAGEADVGGLLGESGQLSVVLTHSPAHFPQVVRPHVRLVLAGHSHAGQWRLPGLGVPWVPKGTGAYVAGWYRHQTTWLHVSPGLGWSIAPLRLWCPPELSRIRLRPA